MLRDDHTGDRSAVADRAVDKAFSAVARPAWLGKQAGHTEHSVGVGPEGRSDGKEHLGQVVPRGRHRQPPVQLVGQEYSLYRDGHAGAGYDIRHDLLYRLAGIHPAVVRLAHQQSHCRCRREMIGIYAGPCDTLDVKRTGALTAIQIGHLRIRAVVDQGCVAALHVKLQGVRRQGIRHGRKRQQAVSGCQVVSGSNFVRKNSSGVFNLIPHVGYLLGAIATKLIWRSPHRFRLPSILLSTSSALEI